MKRLLPLAVLLAAVMPALAAPAATAQREIAGLMQALEHSGCRFQRNGRWHGAAEARDHLQRKYDYLRKRELAGSAGQFIDNAASRSSLSGKPYRVACPDQPEQDAAPWFRQQLARLRGP
ncbi:conserved exported hypothetical protein [uncultured Stenotrophomonas sp.]|uniref:Secreted protein n=1 Tax=uncultured Stenotrophomonas sp. TaxID=165438 RepID=A0A1Y5Q0R0_9GAMM|nr:conserved exported hypothetical protein [uncultured Stenotrophomonas sp.]